MKAIIYGRVSTAEQAASGLGLEAQLQRCRGHAVAGGHSVIEEICDNGCSGSLSPPKRPGLSRALAMLEAGEAGLLIAAKCDRLGRDLGDVNDLAKRAKRERWALAVLDCGVDTSTAAGTAFFQVLGVFAEFERNVIAERTSAALQAKKARGDRLGRPVEYSAEARGRVAELRDSGLSLAAAARQLTAEGIETPRGGRWHAKAVSRLERSAALDAEAAAARAAK